MKDIDLTKETDQSTLLNQLTLNSIVKDMWEFVDREMDGKV